MNSRWNVEEAKKLQDDLDLRVYTSRLMGVDSNLVLHGGGNTSVKIKEKNLFGEEEEILYVKGSGWDLSNIEREGFAPVKMDALLKMAQLENLSDPDMVKNQRVAMTNPSAPNPSIEAILHAVIPFKFVDHTHSDAVVTVTNTPNGEDKIKEIYGSRVLIIPYVMPGFILAKTIYDMTKDLDWSSIEGLILMNHGIFTFSDDGKEAYENMISLVTEAENFIQLKKRDFNIALEGALDLEEIAILRQKVSKLAKKALVGKIDETPLSLYVGNLENGKDLVSRGCLTPEHVIRTKRHYAYSDSLEEYGKNYEEYFKRNAKEEIMLDPAPRVVLGKFGSISFGKNAKEASVIEDIKQHTLEAILSAESLGGWNALAEEELFSMEYWELEQAKLRKGGSAPLLQGKSALIIGEVEDLNSVYSEFLKNNGAEVSIGKSVEEVIESYCGLDLVVVDSISKVSEMMKKFLNLGISPKIVVLNWVSEEIGDLEIPTVQITLNKEINQEEFNSLLTMSIVSENSKNILVN